MIHCCGAQLLHHAKEWSVGMDGRLAGGWQDEEGVSTCSSLEDDSWDEDEDLAAPTALSCSKMGEMLGQPKEHLRRERVQELLATEREYVKDLEALLQVAKRSQTIIVQLRPILGNTEEVVKVARQLLHGLEEANRGTGREQQLGHLFLNFTQHLSQVYQEYCSHYSIHVLPLLKKYEESEEAKEELVQLAEDLHSLRPHIISLNTALIKPVQRILRYRLYLDHLLKDTPSTHPDFPLLQEACTYLDAAANQINEYTRGLDLVSKYSSEVDHSLHAKMRRVSLHSLAKKSVRISTRLSQRLGIRNQTACIELEEEEAKFHSIQRAVLALVNHTKNLLEAVQARHTSELLVSEALGDILHAPYLEHIKKAAQQSCDKSLKTFTSEVVYQVLQPAGELAALCEAPAQLIQKRHHKKLDYDAALAKQVMREEVNNTYKPKIREKQEVVKAYEALQYLLLEELPVLTLHGQEMIITALSTLAAARLYLQGRLAQLYLQLAQVDSFAYSDPKAAQARAQYQVEWLLRLLPQNLLKKHVTKDHLGTATIRSKTKPRLFPVEKAVSPDHYFAINSIAGPATSLHFKGRHSDSVYRKSRGTASLSNKRRSLPVEYLSGITSTLHSPAQRAPSTFHIPVPEAEFSQGPEPPDGQGPEPPDGHLPVLRACQGSMVAVGQGELQQIKPAKEFQQASFLCRATQENEEITSPELTAAVLKRTSDAADNSERWVADGKERKGSVRSERSSEHNKEDSSSSSLIHSLTAVKQPHQEEEKESEETYTALYTFTAEDHTQLSLVPGQRVVLLFKDDTEGWWFVKAGRGEQGYVPATYLTPPLS